MLTMFRTRARKPQMSAAAATTEASRMLQRPKGVTVLSLLALIGGILYFTAGFVLMFGGSLGTAAGVASGWTIMAFGAVMFSLGLVSFVLGFGFWTMRRWAAPAAMAVYGAGTVMNVLSVVFANASPISIILPVAVAAAVIWYVNQPDTRAVLSR
jgi:hypothetical protein